MLDASGEVGDDTFTIMKLVEHSSVALVTVAGAFSGWMSPALAPTELRRSTGGTGGIEH
jgi:hypothetical protein